MLIEQSVRDFSARLAAGTATPGGGSAAALAGGLAASLAQMVCDLSIGKEAYRAHEAALLTMRRTAETLRAELLDLVDKDALAYDGVMAALRLPKATDGEKAARKMAMAQANMVATETPMATALACRSLLAILPDLAAKGNRNAASDVGTAAVLAQAGLRAAAMNVRINIGSLADAERASGLALRIAALESEGDALADRCLATLSTL